MNAYTYIYGNRLTNGIDVTITARDREEADTKLENLLMDLEINKGVRLPAFNTFYIMKTI